MPAQSTRTRLPGSGTATPQASATRTIASADDVARSASPDPLVLRLRGARIPHQRSQSAEQTQEQQPATRRRTIQWAEDVIDNEGLGRKKSKVCCIFHKTREFGESSSEEDSDSSSSDSDASSGPSDDGAARPVGGNNRRARRKGRGRKHDHGDDCDGHAHGHQPADKRKPSPNAYEKMPKYDVKPLGRQPGS
ncbi:Type 1 phosphatases regulator ypi1 [Neophaeococcomyces mojaviensis]|uniref:Type 1 phosphatases regulator ypi1 n=1 Tax=Neophaeococcomyces mojaviensis TaxID=3383035 RepID=A0ACC2ZVD5_9EURO|nr:Type 1 phosphatases regulator ypi1 [Knufia sp. JES_112]